MRLELQDGVLHGMIVTLNGILANYQDGTKEISMRSLCHSKIKTLKEYFELEPSRVYICDLNHNAPKLIKEAQTLGIGIYGNSGRRPSVGKWISVCASGMNQPTTY